MVLNSRKGSEWRPEIQFRFLQSLLQIFTRPHSIWMMNQNQIQLNSPRLGQCYNCQRFGHSALNCKADPICRHCAGAHESREHKKDENTQIECIDCGGSHKSNYRGCPNFLKAEIKGNKERPTTNRKSPQLTIEPTQIPEDDELGNQLPAFDELEPP
ncbi:hypothetical protein JTB14_013028 [Gonioctena quinquepunctata]|nr:hypothetical protein JTB14_013028 [Gonioctena quinquepunctata]